MIGIQCCQISVFPNSICRFNAISIRIPITYFVAIDKVILKFTWTDKKINSQHDIEVEEQSQRTDTISQDLKATVIKEYGTGKSRDREINGENREPWNRK